jgi:2-C-methyl-D-erythritol 4-phosphate cytidylyltransferase
MGGADKIWSSLAGHPVVWHSLTRLGPRADSICLVVRQDQLQRAAHELRDVDDRLRCVAGGPERQDSVANGLHALETVDVVAVHDVARPLATSRLLDLGVSALARAQGAIPVLPLQDTVKQVDEAGTVIDTVDRSTLRAAQTPQVFVMDALVRAHELARREGRTGTDDASLLEAGGYRVTTFPGSPSNLKITTAHDLKIACALLQLEIRP